MPRNISSISIILTIVGFLSACQQQTKTDADLIDALAAEALEEIAQPVGDTSGMKPSFLPQAVAASSAPAAAPSQGGQTAVAAYEAEKPLEAVVKALELEQPQSHVQPTSSAVQSNTQPSYGSATKPVGDFVINETEFDENFSFRRVMHRLKNPGQRPAIELNRAWPFAK